MFIKRLLKVVAASVLVLTVAGCGEDGTNGSLALLVFTEAKTGAVGVTATASVTPAKNSTEVKFTMVQYGLNSGNRETFTLPPSTQYTNPSGVATYSYNVEQKTFDTTVDVTATCQGLTKTASALVPALVQ